MLRLDNINFSRNGSRVLSDVSLAVQPGQLLKIVGGNGSGKTTLLKIISYLLPADSGTLYWNDQTIDEDSDAYREQLLYIGHNNGIAGDLTPIENLRASAGLRRRPPRQTAMQALQAAGMEQFAQRHCRQLSAGQKRRVALARLQLFSATLWLLDEPLAALDSDGREMSSGWLATHLNNGGMAVSTMHRSDDWDVPASVINM